MNMRYKNLGDFLVQNSREHHDRIAYQIKRGLRTKRFTFSEVFELSKKTAAFLSSRGITKGDKVAIWAPNMPEYPMLYFGCWLLGAVAVPIDVRTTQDTLKVFLTKAKCKIGFKGRFVPGSFGNLVEESFFLEDLVELVKNGGEPQDFFETGLNDLAEIAFTSGTTGTPKGVMLTHGNFLADVDSLTEAFPFKKHWRALSLLPLSHAFEQVVDFLVLFKEGIQVTYLERTNRVTILKAMRKNKITSVVLVPQGLHLLMNGIENEVEKQGKRALWEKLNSIAPKMPIWARRLLFRQVHKKFGGKLKFFGCGSAPLNTKLAKKWEALGIEIFEGYGATETTAAATINTPFAKRLGSAGKPLPRVKIKTDEEGEILIKGPNISPGYFEDEQKTKAAFADGWYKSGDMGNLDRDGFLFITGRAAFRIVLPNGQKVYPEDLEKKLNAHPLVSDSCVIGVKKEEGETVHAAIITKHPKKLDSIIKDVNLKLASHEQIQEWSLWPDEDFPRTPILKIDRKKVLGKIQEDHGAELAEKEIVIKTEDKLISLISQVSRFPSDKIKENSILGTDLKIDSLGRVELLSLIEQEFGAAVPESKINQQTSVIELRHLIKESPAAVEEIPINNFLYTSFAMQCRAIIQRLPFLLHSIFVPMEVSGEENLKKVSFPAIFYFNHIGLLDGLCVLRVLPRSIRKRLVAAVTEQIWHDYRRFWVEFFGAAFPFDKKEKIKASLELTGDFLDSGFSVLMAPEGTFTKDGKLLQFKPGIGLLAVEARVPVVPIKIDPSYLEIFPPMDGKFMENIPKKRKKIWIKIGKPLTFGKDISYDEAAQKMQSALERL
jgi:long-chain acyl-CoA synthetase